MICVCRHSVFAHEDLDGGTHECQMCACVQFVEEAEMTLEEMFATYSSRWSLRVWWNDYATYGAKLGPLSLIAYRWFDDRWRVSWTWNWSRFGYEHIVIGGPLT